MSGFSFSDALLSWYDQHGRHDLPWQVTDDPYKVWVSEIMLQQTQVKTVLNYFDRFMQRFPTVHDLGTSTWDEVTPYWAGLGYYARARNLHKAAAIVHQQGHFPSTLEQWMALPGIGRSTAGALMSLGLGQYGVILDGNVKRVLARYFAIEKDLSKTQHEREMWLLAEQLCPSERNADYTQAIMDFGATLCTPKKPLCTYCPMHTQCQAYLQGRELEFPRKKTKKIVPVKTAQVLIIHCDESWFWQQRDPQGLWGGLYCLPIVDTQVQMNEWVQQHKLQPLKATLHISHSFTHFTWQLQAHSFRLDPELKEHFSLEINGQWLTPAQAIAKGIPTAMKKLIRATQTQSTTIA